jgi:Tfp pilus assembly protein PilN
MLAAPVVVMNRRCTGETRSCGWRITRRDCFAPANAAAAAPLDARQAENFTTGLAALAAGQFTPMQQQAIRSITQMEQTKQTLKQVEQLYKDRQNPPKPNKPAKKPNG